MSKMQNHNHESVNQHKSNLTLQKTSEDAHIEESKSLSSLIFFISELSMLFVREFYEC
jgi:hypothetical protein